jgi:hypothetical protein
LPAWAAGTGLWTLALVSIVLLLLALAAPYFPQNHRRDQQHIPFGLSLPEQFAAVYFLEAQPDLM